MAQKNVNESMKMLEEGIKKVTSQENFLRYLHVQSQMYHYSVNNLILIALQKPDATMVAGFQKWKSLGRHVKAGEKGIRILAPYTYSVKEKDEATGEEKDTKRVGFSTTTVFDLSQTDGKPIPQICHELKGTVDEYKTILEAITEVADVPVMYENITDGSLGYFSRTSKKIVIKTGMSEKQTVKTLCHEVAHSVLHVGDGAVKPREVKEVEAESVAYVVCDHFGIECGDYSFEYLGSWGSRDMKELQASFNVIHDVASKLIDNIEARLALKNIDEQEKAAV